MKSSILAEKFKSVKNKSFVKIEFLHGNLTFRTVCCIHYFQKRKIFTSYWKINHKTVVVLLSRNYLLRRRFTESQFLGEIGWVLKKGMRLKIELLMLNSTFFSPTFRGCYCSRGKEHGLPSWCQKTQWYKATFFVQKFNFSKTLLSKFLHQNFDQFWKFEIR